MTVITSFIKYLDFILKNSTDPGELFACEHINDTGAADGCFERHFAGMGIRNGANARGIFAEGVIANCSEE
jgi:hypothetical protein